MPGDAVPDTDAFGQLHPAVQYHVVNSLGWATLRPTQLDAIGPIHLNKIALIDILAVLLTVIFMVLANKKQMVPKGVQNLGESAVNFIDEGVVQQTIGHGGEKFVEGPGEQLHPVVDQSVGDPV